MESTELETRVTTQVPSPIQVNRAKAYRHPGVCRPTSRCTAGLVLQTKYFSKPNGFSLPHQREVYVQQPRLIRSAHYQPATSLGYSSMVT